MSNQNTHRYCVIMCGGIGSRFWPYSRTDRPKQFIDFFGTGRSLLQMTFDRILNLVPKENVIIVTNLQYEHLVRQQLPEISESNLLLEPCRRNTAPCIGWAAAHIMARDPEASMIVTPSDHLITNEKMFEQCVEKGFDFVEKNDALLTLGIKPTRPETGYGYIQIGQEVEPGILKVKTFTEKPDIEIARVFFESGEFFWNSGIFLWRGKTILDAFRNVAPDLTREFEKGSDLFGTDKEQDFIREHFPYCPSISIDYAVMEKASNVYVECVTFGWNDLGTWSALYDNSPKNREGNVTQRCNVITYNSTGNIFAVRDEKVLVVSGLKDYIVADAGDVLLICPKAEEQQIKQMVNDIAARFDDKYL
ncbi:MAG: mannose-1-phosphate guanylyltransferase [Paramuribaculum sp.]|nr:mannose-1-phosphate guanylyltransferase [Paramuribaculum sp.]